MSRDLLSKNFVEFTHEANSGHWAEVADHPITIENLNPQLPGCWLDYRLLNNILPFLNEMPSRRWLTLGDGRSGIEAFFMRSNGGDVLATDMDIRNLQKMCAIGALDKCQKENAEQLTFENDSFDFVFCKEMLHHLARPYLGLYEMHRVCSQAFIFMEPTDYWAPENPTLYAQEHLKRSMWEELGVKDGMMFEPCGNYAYLFSRREIEKCALGLNLRWMAFKGLCTNRLVNMKSFEPEKGEQYRMDDSSQAVSELKDEIVKDEFMCKKGWKQYGKCVWALFKTPEIDEKLHAALIEDGWTVKELPENPYLDAYSAMGS